jgi:hypothetical protein
VVDLGATAVSRHTWGSPFREPYRTERHCQQCGVVKVTRHEPGQLPWLEFERDGLRMVTMAGRVPPCEEIRAPLNSTPGHLTSSG